MIQAVGFDLDDTLYDHAEFVRGAYRQVAAAAARLGLAEEEFFQEIYSNWQELTSRCSHIFSDALRRRDGFSPEAERSLLRAYRSYRPAVLHPLPGVVSGLEALREAGLGLGVLTDGQPALQRHKLAALGLKPFFRVVVITGDWGPDLYKPHAKGFRRLAGELGVEPQNMAYVGDNPMVDFAAPKRLGMLTLRIKRGEYRNLPDPAEVDQVFADTNQAMDWLLEVAGKGALDG